MKTASEIEAEVYARIIEAIQNAHFGPQVTAEDARAFIVKSLVNIVEVMRIQGGAASVKRQYRHADGNVVQLTNVFRNPLPDDSA
jgi:hypothetical protein